jgi:hypothetical protein
MASQENVFYRDGSVLVTNARAVLGASTAKSAPWRTGIPG